MTRQNAGVAANAPLHVSAQLEAGRAGAQVAVVKGLLLRVLRADGRQLASQGAGGRCHAPL